MTRGEDPHIRSNLADARTEANDRQPIHEDPRVDGEFFDGLMDDV